LVKYPLLFFVVVYAVLRYRIQTVHINGYHPAFMIAPARLLGRTTIVTPHHLPESPILLRWYAMNARWAHCAVNVSRVVDRQHRALLPRVRSQIIPNWMPYLPDHLPARPAEPTRRILFVGRLVANKGLPDLLDAIRALRGDVQLIVAGDGPLRGQYESQAAGLPVTFLGFHPDLTPLYRQVDALVVPSHGPEGSCLVALEAMAHGVPCILSDLPVYREIAEEGKTALLFPVGNATDLAAAVRGFFAANHLRTQLPIQAFCMLQRQYSLSAATGIYLQVFGLS
jgi:glycosyltransferase involved in cell wall biosynthesis